MGAIVMVAANDGINHETGYRHEHEKKKAWERHYIPLPSAYAIRLGLLMEAYLFFPMYPRRGRNAKL
jgi:hypothetical protein